MIALVFISFMLFVRLGYQFVTGRCCESLDTFLLKALNWCALAATVLIFIFSFPVAYLTLKVFRGGSWVRSRIVGFLNDKLKCTQRCFFL